MMPFPTCMLETKPDRLMLLTSLELKLAVGDCASCGDYGPLQEAGEAQYLPSQRECKRQR